LVSNFSFALTGSFEGPDILIRYTEFPEFGEGFAECAAREVGNKGVPKHNCSCCEVDIDDQPTICASKYIIYRLSAATPFLYHIY